MHDAGRDIAADDDRGRRGDPEDPDGRNATMSNNPFDNGVGGYGSVGVTYGDVAEGAAGTVGRDAGRAPAQAGAMAGAAGGGAAGGEAGPVDVTTQSFVAEVIEASKDRVVLVDFWAGWCGPCKQLAPVIERVVASYGGAVKLAKMDIDAHPAVAGQLGVQSLPTVLAFAKGQPVDGFMGAVPESEIRAFIERVIQQTGLSGAPAGLPVDEMLAEAALRMEAGDTASASEIYVAILSEQPEEARAIAGLASVRLAGGDAEGARGMIEQVPEADRARPEVAAVLARLDLMRQVEGLGDENELRARLEADPGDHQARYDLALIADALGKRDEAADGLVEIMRRDREWNGDGARKQLVTLFESWGAKDPATLRARRKMSSLMFS